MRLERDDFFVFSEGRDSVITPAYELLDAAGPGCDTDRVSWNPTMSRRQLVSAAAGAAALLVAAPARAAHTGVARSPKPKLSGMAKANVLRWDSESEATSINPLFANGNPGARIMSWVHNGLLRFTNATEKFQFSLATSLKAAKDGTLYEFKLRPGVKWHDGTPFTASDVATTYQTALTPSYGSVWRSFLSPIQSVEVVDPLTVRFHMTTPFNQMLSVFAAMPIVKASDAPNKDVLAGKHVGTGAFIINAIRSGDRTILSANPNYFRAKHPFVHGVEQVITPDPSTRVINLETGQTAVTSDVAWPQLAGLKKKRVTIYDIQHPPNRDFLIFNGKNPAFADVNFRKALAYSINRQQIVNTVFAGHAVPSTGSMSSGCTFYDATIKTYGARPYAQDLAMARQFLAKATVKPSSPPVVTYGSISDLRNIATILQANWQSIGVNVQLQELDVVSALAKLNQTRDFDIYLQQSLAGVFAGRAPYPFLNQFKTGTVQNWAVYSDPETDKQVAIAEQGLDRRQIISAVHSVQRLDAELCWYIGVVDPDYVEAQGVPLTGYHPSAMGNLPYKAEDARIG